MKTKKHGIVAILCLSMALVISACGGKSDADITKEVQGRVKTSGVTVSGVKDGVVTLGGTVTTAVEREQAEAAAKGEGVKSVVNNIQIKPIATPTPMTPMTTNPPMSTAPNGTRPGTTMPPAGTRPGTTAPATRPGTMATPTTAAPRH